MFILKTTPSTQINKDLQSMHVQLLCTQCSAVLQIFCMPLIGILLTKIHILKTSSMRAFTAHNYIVIYTPI